MTKEAFRQKYKTLRFKLSEETTEELSLKIANNALQLPVWGFNNYHLFLSIPEKMEVNTEYLLHILQGRDKSIVLPKVSLGTPEMTHILLQDNTILKPSNYGVPEPVSGLELKPLQIDVVFVPLLAYDTIGNRLGYGGGFYDRFLIQCKPETIFIGLSYFEPEEKIPSEVTDIPLHFCVTPNKIYKF
jgi:5-formyltetrahydrofolate cyclo-ligase